jgi:hypothetical protein
VKFSLYQVLYSVIANLSIIACCVPFVLLWRKKLLYIKAYLFIAIYWLLNALINLPNWFGQENNYALQSQLTLLYNFADAPLMLFVFYFSFTGAKRRTALITLGFFISFEIATVMFLGYNNKSLTVITGADTVIAICFCVLGIIGYLKKMEHTPRENAMVFAYAGLLFSYGIFIIIYLFSYLEIKAGTDAQDNFFLYYLSLLLASMLTSYGIWFYASPKLSRAKTPQGINSYSSSS